MSVEAAERTEELLTGREMDARIAALIGDTQDEEGWWVSRDGSRISVDDGGPRHYSTEIAEAWKVVEKLIREGQGDFHIEHVGSTDGQHHDWCAGRFCFDPAEKWGYADTAPLAICRAALKACEAIR